MPPLSGVLSGNNSRPGYSAASVVVSANDRTPIASSSAMAIKASLRVILGQLHHQLPDAPPAPDEPPPPKNPPPSDELPPPEIPPPPDELPLGVKIIRPRPLPNDGGL
jgi:hypothetical protein